MNLITSFARKTKTIIFIYLYANFTTNVNEIVGYTMVIVLVK